MNTDELKTDFIRRFGESPHSIRTASVGMPLYFCGNPDKAGFDTISAPLGMKTTVVFRRTDNLIVDLCEEDNVRRYTSPFASLDAHKNVVMRFFGYYKRNRIPLCGIQMLIANEMLEPFYPKAACAAAASAMSALTGMPASDTALSKVCAGFFGEGLTDFMTMLAARRGYCIYRRSSGGKFAYLPLGAAGYRIILIRIPEAGQGKKHDTALRISFTNTVTASAAEILETRGFAEFAGTASSVDSWLCRGASNACEDILGFEGVSGLKESRGIIWAAVDSARTDAAASKIEDAFLKHTGILPEIYITGIMEG